MQVLADLNFRNCAKDIIALSDNPATVRLLIETLRPIQQSAAAVRPSTRWLNGVV